MWKTIHQSSDLRILKIKKQKCFQSDFEKDFYQEENVPDRWKASFQKHVQVTWEDFLTLSHSLIRNAMSCSFFLHSQTETYRLCLLLISVVVMHVL